MDRLTSMRNLALLTTVGLSILAVIGDYFLKRASAEGAPWPHPPSWQAERQDDRSSPS